MSQREGVRWAVERALKESSLPAPSRLVALVLLTRAHASSGEIPAEHTPSLSTQARETGLSRSVVAEHLNRLEFDGWVDRLRPSVADQRSSKARTRYRFTDPSAPFHPARQTAEPVDKPCIGTSPGAGLVREPDGGSPGAGPVLVREPDLSSPGAGHVLDLDQVEPTPTRAEGSVSVENQPPTALPVAELVEAETDSDAASVAAAVLAVRPEWSLAAVLTAINKARSAGRKLDEISVTFVDCAGHPDTKAPGRLSWWAPKTPPVAREQLADLRRCSNRAHVEKYRTTCPGCAADRKAGDAA